MNNNIKKIINEIEQGNVYIIERKEFEAKFRKVHRLLLSLNAFGTLDSTDMNLIVVIVNDLFDVDLNN